MPRAAQGEILSANFSGVCGLTGGSNASDPICRSITSSRVSNAHHLPHRRLRLHRTREPVNRVDAFSKAQHLPRMGKVIVKIKLTNQGDLVLTKRKLSKAKPRTVDIEALVDTGATRLYLKPSVIKALGLEKLDEIISQTTNGPKRRSVYESVRLDLQGRYGEFNVVDIGENVPNLLGQIPLEYLDFVVDSKNRKLIPNPEHGDKQMSEEY